MQVMAMIGNRLAWNPTLEDAELLSLMTCNLSFLKLVEVFRPISSVFIAVTGTGTVVEVISIGVVADNKVPFVLFTVEYTSREELVGL